MNEVKAIALREEQGVERAEPVRREYRPSGFDPANVSEAMEMAKCLVDSRLLPGHIRTPQAAFAIIATGRELGLSPMQSIRMIHVIEGRPTLSADAMVALCRQAECCRGFRLVESTDRIATWETHREGEPEPVRMSFSIEDAQRAGLASRDTWKKYPAAMLRARAASALCRAVYQDVCAGLYTEEEIATQEPIRARVESVEPKTEETTQSSGEAKLVAWRKWWINELGPTLFAEIVECDPAEIDSYRPPADASKRNDLMRVLQMARADLEADAQLGEPVDPEPQEEIG